MRCDLAAQEVPVSAEAVELDQNLPDGYRGVLAPAFPGALIQPFTLPREAPPPAAKVRRALHEAAACLRWWAHRNSDAEPAPRHSLLALLERMHGPTLQPEGAPGTVAMHGKGIMRGAGVDVEVLRRDAQAVAAMLTDRHAMASTWTSERHDQYAPRPYFLVSRCNCLSQAQERRVAVSACMHACGCCDHM